MHRPVVRIASIQGWIDLGTARRKGGDRWGGIALGHGSALRGEDGEAGPALVCGVLRFLGCDSSFVGKAARRVK